MTVPDEAARFVTLTGVDSLAISIGNTHGQSRGATHLDLDRLRRIHDATATPLVLHGGSGVSDEQMRLAIQSGICKVNVATELHRAYVAAMRDQLDHSATTEARALMEAARAAVEAGAREKVRLFGASGQA
jgi:fructose/tagatose bisphosphate aldolase